MGSVGRVWVVVLVVASMAGCADEQSPEAIRTRAIQAVSADDWARAVEVYLDAEGLDAEMLDLVDRVRSGGHQLPVETENQLMDWLEERGHTDRLRGLLTDSTVSIPEGWVTIGTDDGMPDERPVHDVWISDFRIDRHEVTNLEYAPFAEAFDAWPPYWSGRAQPASIARHPVVGVSWEMASAFCEWSGGRLPTEAEWERACRGPASFAYPWGDRWVDGHANVTIVPLGNPEEAWQWVVPEDEATFGLTPVGRPAEGATPEGVCNLAGNVFEWTVDWHSPDAYRTLSTVDPVGTEPEWNHVVRGGAWLFRSDDVEAARYLSRCTTRNSSHVLSDARMGFRCVHEP